MNSTLRRLMKTSFCSLLSAASLGCLLTSFSQPAVGEIILGPAPGASLSAQSAQYNRQRAILERSRNDNGEFRVSPNIVLIDGYNTWGGINTWGGVNAWGGPNSWAATGSAAAYGAAYNRRQAIANQVFMGNHSSSHHHSERANAYRNRGH